MPTPTPAPRPTAEDRIRAASGSRTGGSGCSACGAPTPTGCVGARRARPAPARQAPDRPPGVPRAHHGPRAHPDPALGRVGAQLRPRVPRGRVRARRRRRWGRSARRARGQLGPLPPTLRTNTAHGQHVFLRWPEGLPRPIGQLLATSPAGGRARMPATSSAPARSTPRVRSTRPPGRSLEIAELPDAWAAGGRRADAGGRRREYRDRAAATSCPAGLRRRPVRRDPRYIAQPLHARGLEATRSGRASSPSWPLGSPNRSPSPSSGPASSGRGRTRRSAWRPVADPEAEAAIMAARPGTGRADRASDWPAPPDDAVYHGPLGEIVRAVAPHTEADPVGVLGTLLASVGAAMGTCATSTRERPGAEPVRRPRRRQQHRAQGHRGLDRPRGHEPRRTPTGAS